MERLLLNPAKHPFYEHASREMFVAYRDSELVGRVVAIKDTMHNEHYNDQVGFFGFFETVDDQAVADALLNAAEGWLKEQGCNAHAWSRQPVDERRVWRVDRRPRVFAHDHDGLHTQTIRHPSSGG